MNRASPEEYKAKAKSFLKLIKKKKKECWAKFLKDEVNRDLWEVVRIARNPFGIRESMRKIRDEDGTELESQQDRVQAFQKQNLISNPLQAQCLVIAHSSMPFKEAAGATLRLIHGALQKTKKNSLPGPGRIPYRLIKFIMDTDLGRCRLHDLATTVEGSAHPIWEQRDLLIVMIPKPGKDLTSLSLAKTTGKLRDNVIANCLQRHLELMHHLQ